jgi:hypothetical protein
LSKAFGNYESGILNDMAVANDMARLSVFSRYKDSRLFGRMDGFDRAADRLGQADRKRYYMAKSRLRSEKAPPLIDSVTKEWFSLLSADCCRAARLGNDAEKCVSYARSFAEKCRLPGRVLDESTCRITQEYARHITSEAFRLAKARDREKALRLGLAGIKEIPPLTVLADTDDCSRWKSEGVLLARYDSLFVRPLCAAAGSGRGADEIRTRVCERYWQHRQLVAAVLPRVATPSSDAFSLFKKAGRDDVLRHDGRIAVSEMLLWKKAGKLKEYRTEFPERFALAKRTAVQKKSR